MKISVIGGGLSGLLAGNLMRNIGDVTVYEKNQSTQVRHTAILRMRSEKLFHTCQVPLEEIRVMKSIFFEGKHYDKATLDLINLYSLKVSDKVAVRSIKDLDEVTRYVCPTKKIIELLEKNVPSIEYGTRVDETFLKKNEKDHVIISTVPMNHLMYILEWSDIPDFKYAPVYVSRFKLKEDLVSPKICQTVYLPGSETNFYRMTLQSNELILESIGRYWEKDWEGGYYAFSDQTDPQMRERVQPIFEEVEKIFRIFRLDKNSVESIHFNTQEFGKIQEISEKVRQDFIRYATEKYNIYSLGRFACWKNLLTDDTFESIFKIMKMIQADSDYMKHKYLTNLEENP